MTKEELLERARELDVPGRSSMSKEELEEAVAEAESSSDDESGDERDPVAKALEDFDPEEQKERQRSKIEGSQEDLPESGVEKELEATHHLPASDPEVVGDALNEGDARALEAMGGEDSEAATEADIGLASTGPLNLQHPAEREATGVVNEAHAKEWEEKVSDLDEDYVGPLNEEGRPLGSPPREVEEEDSDDEDRVERPGPDASSEEIFEYGRKTIDGLEQESAHPEADEDEDEVVEAEPSNPRLYHQKAVLYTDGLSGDAEQNLEYAYEIPETLQSNDPVEREAGDRSLSEEAKEEKSDEEREEAERAKEGDDSDE
jgi:hypothetical protein